MQVVIQKPCEGDGDAGCLAISTLPMWGGDDIVAALEHDNRTCRIQLWLGSKFNVRNKALAVTHEAALFVPSSLLGGSTCDSHLDRISRITQS